MHHAFTRNESHHYLNVFWFSSITYGMAKRGRDARGEDLNLAYLHE